MQARKTEAPVGPFAIAGIGQQQSTTHPYWNTVATLPSGDANGINFHSDDEFARACERTAVGTRGLSFTGDSSSASMRLSERSTNRDRMTGSDYSTIGQVG